MYLKKLVKKKSHRDIKLVNNLRRRKKTREPNFHNAKDFSEDFAAIEMKKTIIMDTPIYLGCSVLQLSKFLMYKFWYDYLKPKYKDKINLCYNDTDSFVLEIETEGFY